MRPNIVVLDPAYYPMLNVPQKPLYVFEYVGGVRSWSQSAADAVARGGHLATINSAFDQEWVTAVAAGRTAYIGLDGSSNSVWTVTGERVTFEKFGGSGDVSGVSFRGKDGFWLLRHRQSDFLYGMQAGVDSGYLLERPAVETFTDYQFDWTSKPHAVEDTRLSLSFQWTSNSHDLFTEMPVFSLADTKAAVEQQVATTGWVSEPITEHRTVIKPVRVLLDQPSVAVAAFSGDSLQTDGSLVIDAGRDVTLSGLVTARNTDRTTGSIDITAGRDFFMTGAKPAGAADDTLAATAGMTAVSRVAITTGGRFTLASSIDIKADDTAVADSTENKIVITTAGDAIIRGTLTTTNRKVGEVTVNAGDDIELKGEVVAGHVANVLAGTDGTGGITSDISGLVKTLGSEVNFSAGKDGGNISLTDLFIETAGPLTLAAPSGSIANAGGLFSAGTLSGTAASGIDLGTVAAGKLSANVTGTGGIKVFVYGSTIIESLTTADGGIGLQGTGNIELGSITAGGEGNGLSINPVEVLDADGNPVLFSPSVSGNVPFADPLYLVAEGGKTINTATSELHLNVVTAGDVTVNHIGSDPLTVYVSTMDGSLTINTDGDLIVVDLRLLTNKAGHTVTLNAGGDVLIGKISAGEFAATADEADAIRVDSGLAAGALFTTLPGVAIKAGGAIREIGEGDAEIDIIAGKLTLEAVTGIGRLEVAVSEVTKATTTTGSITLIDTDGAGELKQGLNLIEASAAAGGVTVTTTGPMRIGSAMAGGVGQNLVLTASGGAIEMQEHEEIISRLSSAGDIDLTAAGDISLLGGVTAAGSVTVTAAGGVRASGSDFRWSAGGPLSIDAAARVVLGGAIAAVESVSIVSETGDIMAPVAFSAASGTFTSFVLAAGGNLDVSAASIPTATKSLSLTAGRQMFLGLDQPALVVTAKDGQLTISAGGDLVLLADTVLKADARITLASTGYVDDLGMKHGGTLSLIATPKGFSTALTKELVLTGNTVVHLTPAATASEQVTLGGRVMFSQYGVLRLQTDQILSGGGSSESVVSALTGSVAAYAAPKMSLADGTVLVLDEGSDATDQFAGIQEIALNQGTVTIEVPEGSTVPVPVVFTGTGGLRKTGDGVLVLSGTQASTGSIRIEAGTLLINGSTGAGIAVTVAGGTLGGTGTVAGPVTVGNGGTLAVGPQAPASVAQPAAAVFMMATALSADGPVTGSLQVGSVVFEAGSTLLLRASPTEADSLYVTGSITIDPAAAVHVTALDGFVPGTTPLVVIYNDTTTDPVVGRFGTVTVVDGEGNTLISGFMYTAGDGNDIALISDVDPPTGGAVVDGPAADIDFQVSLTTINATWSGFTDGDGTGIDRYEWAIGTTSGGQDVLAYTSAGITGTAASRSGLSLTSGTTYYVSVRAIDRVGNVSNAVASDGVMADAVAPVAGTVKDGPVAGSDITYQKSATSFSASWSGYGDVNGSGIDRYEWAIGTTPGGQEVTAFTSVGMATEATANELSLGDNVKYYVTVKAIDRAANATAVTTDGVTVYSLPPVVTAPNIKLSGGTAGGGVFKPRDTVTARWNDTPAGDNNSHVLASVTMDFSRFGGPQLLPATLQDGVWTASYRIAAGFTGTNRNVAVTVVDAIGNITTTSGTDNAMIAIPGGLADFTDSDGDRYRVQLTGPGLLAIDHAAGVNGRGPIQRIQVAATNPLRTALRVVPLGYARSGDQRVSIGSIAGTGLVSIVAASSDLVGEGITLTGRLGYLIVRDVANGASIRAGGVAATQTTIRARTIGSGGEIRLGSTLASLVAQDVGAVHITAAAVGMLYATGNGQTIRPVLAGNFAADLDIKGSVTLVSIAGAVRGGNWKIGGDLGSLTVRGATSGLTMAVGGTLTSASLGIVRGAAIDVGRKVTSFTSSTFTSSHLYVGFTPTNPADPMADATSVRFNQALVTRIDSFVVTARTATAFAGSTIAARRIGFVSLSCVATDSLSQFGVLADDSIRSVVVGKPLVRVANRTAPGDYGKHQFRVRIV